MDNLKTRKSVWLHGVHIALLFVCFMMSDFIVQPASAEEYVSDNWQFSITPYFWALTLEGDVAVKGNESSVDVDFNTIWDNLSWAGMFEAEARKNRVGLFITPLYAQLEDDMDLLNVEMDMAVVGFGGYYRFGPWSLGTEAGASGPVLVTDIYAGGRYTYLELKLKGKVFGLLDKKGDQDWVDPIIGARTIWALSPKWTVMLRGDVGGFGVSSDFAWQATGAVGYGFKLFGDDNAKIWAGYKAVGQDYSKGSGSDKFKWDTTMHGPALGLSYHF